LSDIKHEATVESLISDKARTENVLNGLKNHPSDEFIGEVIKKKQRCLSRENQSKTKSLCWTLIFIIK
jgi:hypothetical protein